MRGYRIVGGIVMKADSGETGCVMREISGLKMSLMLLPKYLLGM